jgi:hypothetical protein
MLRHSISPCQAVEKGSFRPTALSKSKGALDRFRANVLIGKGLSAKRKGFSVLALTPLCSLPLLFASGTRALQLNLFEQPEIKSV